MSREIYGSFPLEQGPEYDNMTWNFCWLYSFQMRLLKQERIITRSYKSEKEDLCKQKTPKFCLYNWFRLGSHHSSLHYFFAPLEDSGCGLIIFNWPPSLVANVAAFTSLQWFINFVNSWSQKRTMQNNETNAINKKRNSYINSCFWDKSRNST